MQYILAFLEESFEILAVFFHINLGGTGFRAVGHGLIELVKGNGLAQIVRVLLAVQLVVEADVMNVPLLKVFTAQIRGRATTEDKRSHWYHSLS